MKTQNPIKSFAKGVTLLLCLTAFVTTESCKDKKGNEPKKCRDDQVLVNGNCQCPPNTYEFQGICKKEYEGTYFVDSSDCECIKRPHEFFLEYNVEDLTNPNTWNGKYYEFQLGYSYKGGGASGTAEFYPEQDSIYSGLFTRGYELDCNKKTFIYGIFSEERKKLKVRVFGYEVDDYFGNRNNATDSCTIWLSNRF